MPKFALEHIPEIKGKVDFYFLIVDNVNMYKEFALKVETDGNMASELRTLQARMQEMAEMRYPMPKTKCRDITPAKVTEKEFELKTKHLRCYLFHQKEKGRIIVLLGQKTSQKKDIKRFRNLKREYLNS